MALDVALMQRARETGESVFRVYGWATPTLSFGRHQSACGDYEPARLRAEGIEVVRRPTGGRALLHDREVTYSVTAPVAAGDGLRATCDRINDLLMNALSRLGVPAVAATSGTRAPAPTATPCFAEPAAGELMVDGRKLVGSAQWRDDGALLQHGSILLEDDQSRIASLRCSSGPHVALRAPATLREALGRRPAFEEVAAALFSSVRALADTRATALPHERLLHREAALGEARFRDPAWTWRR